MASIYNGVRYVKPYYHQFQTSAKRRWFEKPLLHVLTKEMRYSPEYCLHLMETEKLYVNRRGLKIFANTNIQEGDVIYCEIHKHEPPVGFEVAADDGLFDVVYDDPQLLVLNKPCGIPVHPTGNFFNNTVTEILKIQLNSNDIYPCHRLDKLTSGILVVAKNKEKAKQISSLFQRKLVEKTYLAKVSGNFPTNELKCSDPIFRLNPTHRFSSSDDIPVVLQSGLTYFKKLFYDKHSDYSIVQCVPITGRTHQIRIHLRNLGYPIINDSTYGHNSICPVKSQTELSLLEKIRLKYPDPNSVDGETVYLPKTKYTMVKKEFQDRVDSYMYSKCPDCGEALLSQDRLVESLAICLHAWKIVFSFDEPWSCETKVPSWAQQIL